MKRIVAILLVVMLAACGKSVVSQEQFDDYYLTQVVKKYEKFKFVKMPFGGILVTSASGKEYQINTEELYDQYKDSPDSLNAFVEQSVKNLKVSSFDLVDNDKVSIDNILPVVKSAAYINSFSEDEKKNIVMEKYNDSLYLVLIVLNDDLMENLSLSKMKLLDMDYYQVKGVAMGNLEKRTAQFKTTELEGKVIMISAASYVDASMIFTSQIWKKKQIKVEGDYVVTVPNSNSLLVTGSKNKEGLEMLKKITDKVIVKLDRPVSAGFFKFDGEQFRPFVQ